MTSKTATSPANIRRYGFLAKSRLYWSLIKGLQTGLLLATGLAGYMSACCPVLNWQTLAGLGLSLFLAIGGSTILNMWWDRDIDAKMTRACRRPLPSGKIRPNEALIVGLIVSALGVGLALAIDLLYGVIVFAGLFFDVFIYTIWLKRRTPWSIIVGGVAGAMPIMAGRALGLGALDWIGAILGLAILFWIPTHMLTYSMRYYDDYRAAGVPTFPSTYGFQTTRDVIAFSSVLAGLCMVLAAIGIGLSFGYMCLLGISSTILLLLALGTKLRPSERLNFGLFKYASLYMLNAMLLVVLDVL
jgi:protoheme IX farnesyltransferase